MPVHYAGVACEMDAIMALAEKYHLKVVEDAAQGVEAYYHGKALGTIGDFGCYSFLDEELYHGRGRGSCFPEKRIPGKSRDPQRKRNRQKQIFPGTGR